MAFRINNKTRLRSVRINPIPSRLPTPAQSRGNVSSDTHHYDGKLKVHPLIGIITEQQQVTVEEKRRLFIRLIEDVRLNPIINTKYRSTAIQAISKINQDIHKPPNHDKTNDIYADDILYLICKRIDETKDLDILVYLAEQLSDIITSGSCPQGRSTRVFQVLCTIEKHQIDKDLEIEN